MSADPTGSQPAPSAFTRRDGNGLFTRDALPKWTFVPPARRGRGRAGISNSLLVQSLAPLRGALLVGLVVGRVVLVDRGRRVLLHVLDLLDPVLERAPDRGAAPGRDVSLEHEVDLLEGLVRGLRVEEEDVERHEEAEGAEYHVRLPLDVRERWRHEEGEGEVEAAKCRSVSISELSAFPSSLPRKTLTSSSLLRPGRLPWLGTSGGRPRRRRSSR